MLFTTSYNTNTLINVCFLLIFGNWLINQPYCNLQDVAQEFGVQAMPTFILIKRGKEVDKVVGAKKEDLQKKIEKHRFWYIWLMHYYDWRIELELELCNSYLEY